MSQERTFISYQAIDFVNKPASKENEVLEDKIDLPFCEKGVIWAVPLEPDWKETIVDMLCVAPNNCGVLVAFRSPFYRKVDKLKWERKIYGLNSYSERDGWVDCLDDELDDNMAEFVVPFDSMSFLGSVLPTIALADCDIENFAVGRLFQDLFLNNKSLRDEYHKLNELYGYFYDNTQPSSDCFSEAAFATGMACVLFSVIYLPLMVLPLSNGVYDQQVPLYLPWSEYCKKYVPSILKAKSDISEFFIGGCEGGKDRYLELRGRLAAYFDFPAIEVFHGLVRGYERNSPCPCGSGKKWKKCHGKIAK